MSEIESSVKQMRSDQQAKVSNKKCCDSKLESKVDKNTLRKIDNTSEPCQPHPHDILFGRG